MGRKRDQRRLRPGKHLPVASMTCPVCTMAADMGAGLGGAKPKEGDVAVCAQCGALVAFAPNGHGQLHLREATPKDAQRLPMEDQIAVAMAARAVQQTKKPLVFT
jgi:hypothetical protein